MPAPHMVPKFAKCIRYISLGALLALLPAAASADIINEQIDFTVNNIGGTATFSVNTSNATSDTYGTYADPSHGLVSLSVQYDNQNYNLNSFLDFPMLPIVLLPGNSALQNGLSYELIGGVVADGTCAADVSMPGYFSCTGPAPSNEATILGFGPKVEADLVSGTANVDASVSGSSSELLLTGAGISQIKGSITGETTLPEPGYVSVMALGLVGLLLVRRRKAVSAPVKS